MTRFLYLSDTHWGSDGMGYKLQPKYDTRLPELLSALESWISENSPIDFLLHGGDMIHTLDTESLQTARDHFRLSIPVHLCLGNHDLTVKGGLDQWLTSAPEFFANGTPNYGIDTAECTIHVSPNHYENESYYWSKVQDIHLRKTQLEEIAARISKRRNTTHILLTHCPVHPIGTDQTGEAEPFHTPPEAFTRSITSLVEERGISCVLGAHSHANMHKELNGVNYITVSSFVESPFEFKLFEVSADTLSMTTHSLRGRLDFPTDYNFDQTFVQGRARDRSFTKPL